MKVLLIHSSLPEIGNIGKRRRALFPSLTLAYLAALFPKDYRIVLVNDIVEDIPYDGEFDLVGITFYGIAALRAFDIARRFRERGIPVVFGGSTATLQPEFCRPHCDSVVIGEAEHLMPRLLSDFESGRLAPDYSAVGASDISQLPVPRYDLLDRSRYYGIYPVQTARGCIFRCSFCSVPRLAYNTVRYRPIEEVIRDVHAAIASSGSRRIFFVDDNINMKPERAAELFEALIPLRIEWYSYATILIAKQPKVLRLAAESGCRMLFIGFESLSQEMLNDVHKPFNQAKNYREAIETIHAHGIHIMPSFIFGLDGDDPGVFRRTCEFTDANGLSFPVFHVLTPIPGTSTFEQMTAEGRIIENDLRRFDGRHVVFQPRGMHPEELESGFEAARRYIYSLPSILRRTVLRRPVGGWRHVGTQLQMAMLNLHYWWLVRQRFFSIS